MVWVYANFLSRYKFLLEKVEEISYLILKKQCRERAKETNQKKERKNKKNILSTKVYLVLVRNLVLDKIPKLIKKTTEKHTPTKFEYKLSRT